MKSFKSTFNWYLVCCLMVLAAAFFLLGYEALAAQREAVSKALGLPSEYTWMLGSVIALVALSLVLARLHSKLTEPIKDLSRQCKGGYVAEHFSSDQISEVKTIREYIRKTQERADSRAGQIEKMETELFSTRKERDRSFRKVEEFEDLIASYARIRTELNIDNKTLRRENHRLADEVDYLKKQVSDTSRDRGIHSMDS